MFFHARAAVDRVRTLGERRNLSLMKNYKTQRPKLSVMNNYKTLKKHDVIITSQLLAKWQGPRGNVGGWVLWNFLKNCRWFRFFKYFRIEEELSVPVLLGKKKIRKRTAGSGCFQRLNKWWFSWKNRQRANGSLTCSSTLKKLRTTVMNQTLVVWKFWESSGKSAYLLRLIIGGYLSVNSISVHTAPPLLPSLISKNLAHIIS
jgi:hypothetical protein